MFNVSHMFKHLFIGVGVTSILIYGFVDQRFLTNDELFAYIFVLSGYYFSTMMPFMLITYRAMYLYLDANPIEVAQLISPTQDIKLYLVQFIGILFFLVVTVIEPFFAVKKEKEERVKKYEHVKVEDSRVQYHFAQMLAEGLDESQFLTMVKLILTVIRMNDEAKTIQAAAEARKEKEN